MQTNRYQSIKTEIQQLHLESSNECMREWFFSGHVEVVEKYCSEISEIYNGDTELVMLAALFHDIARVWGVNDEPDLMNESISKMETILEKYQYTPEEIDVIRNIILCHSCKEIMPETLNEKIMATSDSLAHLMTNFYFELPFYGWLMAADRFDGYKKWISEKIERDMNKKIFFQEYKDKASPRYEAIKTLFSD